ncbi:2-C-methyl-D-erythritol 4-phosphate cytidylyltransferase [Marinobacter sp. M3C]|jgi:2-C-methyl-D-erythritol 4-phosphate cytidylyltransferase|uniref:2-C-methyl-D-erythritol 4-phosphate cytidylyltransferase n=1 Tax=unclassified Marinobacter TaxID=83889 RepID=UPI00200D0C8E|nr:MULTISPECIES: 2-C-methyl-D-erythritol 4-phosphate cytidylyltransferase [unclassified Marinobacter]MCL1476914.1 2-C-methyl-D-erythritol 4-phosphate cytidylyltransferase [Marinobacter sp.]MCL1482762.1 2-C-methyl-D-erythritol 4-phosphate cytidylyltransferase [Marinobacter sp.]MCL1483453.1 2-C-methyl-D-erythritol 4-phosphate cytidylyltransferase [Marinobacter sp.]MCL1488284.1 2-C-methyl-D-erythritol 4-phosphate cytidylyltransferase [Marinobacter sp.]UQG57573.1 2-C-methyl-D-erythritol 4-phosphat
MPEASLWLIIPAAGVGQRMAAECPKQYLRVDGEYILDITLRRLLTAVPAAGCIVTLSPTDIWWAGTNASSDSRIATCAGGNERSNSVLNALQALVPKAKNDDWVLVHDAARPCVASDDLKRLLEKVGAHSVGGLLASPVTDTLKVASPQAPDTVTSTVDRRHLWRALTPQVFRYGLLRDALQRALDQGFALTDEASAMEQAGHRPLLVEGRPDNIKITVPADLALAGFILGQL